MVTSKETQELYDYFLKNGDNDLTWAYVMKKIKPLVDCQIRSSKLFYSLYDDSRAYIDVAVVNAFRSYKKDSKASIFTWTIRLIRQAIWRYMKDRIEGDKIEFNSDEYDEVDKMFSYNNVDEYIDRQEAQNEAEKQLKHIIKVAIRNDLYAEVYCANHGVLGYTEAIESKRLPEELGLTKKTVQQAIIDNRIRINFIKKFIKKYGRLPKDREEYMSFFKSVDNK